MREKNDTKPTDFFKRVRKKPMWINQNKHCIRAIKTENDHLRKHSGFAHACEMEHKTKKKTWYW